MWYIGGRRTDAGMGAGARCSSFRDRNGGQVHSIEGSTSRDLEKEAKDRKEGAGMMTLTSSKGHSFNQTVW